MSLPIFRDAYFFEFLDLPDGYHETDLHAALLQNMPRFLAELGRDFCFIGSEVPLQVGGAQITRVASLMTAN
jgi:predicted nuclease of restriction endonuclease-like (RecB) superfamily